MLAACATPAPELAAVPAAPIAVPRPPPVQPTVCRPRNDVLALLATKYGEAQVAVGVTTRGNLVEVLTTSDGRTWTIILTTPQGLSCLVASGEGWRVVPRTDPADGPRA